MASYAGYATTIFILGWATGGLVFGLFGDRCGRTRTMMLTILPIFTFVLLFTLNPTFFLDVAGDPWFVPGFVVLIVLYLTGFFTIRKMVDLKV